ncbi:MAG: hypothetical protein ACFE7R_04425 [Candidatus Hodarchaeota archaeon]
MSEMENRWTRRDLKIALIGGFLLFFVYMIGAFWELLVTRDMCMFFMIGYLMSTVVVTAIMMTKRFGMGILVFVPYALIGLPLEYYMEWILDPVLISPFAAIIWSLIGPVVGLSADLTHRFIPKAVHARIRGIITGLVIAAVHFVVMLGALAFLYVNPLPGLEHYLNALGFTLPWLLMNGAFGGYTAYALSRDLSASS